MPSTLVHLALGALLAAGLLGDEFDGRALGLVLAVTAVPDLDTFVGLWLAGTHRALLHNALVPLLLGALVAYDTRVAARSWLASRGAVRLAWVCVAAYALAGVGPDLVTNGVNLFYPVVDRFISLSGQVLVSDQRGLVQTLWQPTKSVVGTTQTLHYATGVDPTPGPEAANVERVFPLAHSGFQLLVVVIATLVSGGRLWTTRAA